MIKATLALVIFSFLTPPHLYGWDEILPPKTQVNIPVGDHLSIPIQNIADPHLQILFRSEGVNPKYEIEVKHRLSHHHPVFQSMSSDLVTFIPNYTLNGRRRWGETGSLTIKNLSRKNPLIGYLRMPQIKKKGELYIEILYPSPRMVSHQDTVDVIGYVSKKGAKVTVSGNPAEHSGHYFFSFDTPIKKGAVSAQASFQKQTASDKIKITIDKSEKFPNLVSTETVTQYLEDQVYFARHDQKYAKRLTPAMIRIRAPNPFDTLYSELEKQGVRIYDYERLYHVLVTRLPLHLVTEAQQMGAVFRKPAQFLSSRLKANKIPSYALTKNKLTKLMVELYEPRYVDQANTLLKKYGGKVEESFGPDDFDNTWVTHLKREQYLSLLVHPDVLSLYLVPPPAVDIK